MLDPTYTKEIMELIQEPVEEKHPKPKLFDFLKRENFSEKGKTIIIRKASLCLMCHMPTTLGECVHIVAAGKKGPRNKDDLVRQGEISKTYDVSDPDDNGLYLCPNCHTLVDKYPKVYTYEFLTRLQQSFHEHFLLEHLKSGTLIDQYPEIYTNLLKRLEQSLQEHIYEKIQSSSIKLNPIPHKGELTSKSDDRGSFVCRHCQKVLHSRVALDYHYSLQVCYKPERICPMCGYQFATKQKCQIHVENKTCQKHPKVKVTLKSTTSEVDS
jgi:hypothetical protein